MYISMGWTAPAFLAGEKTETRRNWKDKYAKKFKIGECIEVWDKSPCWTIHKQKPIKIGTLIVLKIYKQKINKNTFYNRSYQEGFDYMIQFDSEKVMKTKREWSVQNNYLWVLEFKKL